MKTLLSNLESFLYKENNPILTNLHDNSFVSSDFKLVLKNLNLVPTNELIEFYEWSSGLDGQKALDINYPYRLFSFGTHVDYRITSSLFIIDQTTDKNYRGKYLPIIFGGIPEDPILIDLSFKSPTYGQLFYYSPSVTLSSEPVSIYDSLNTLIKTICDCYETGCYQIQKDGTLSSDSEKEQVISDRNNPKSEFWNF